MSTAVTVLSGKGGVAKTLWQLVMAGEASREGVRTLIIDADPERNASNKFNVPQHSTGLGNVFEDAGVFRGGEPQITAAAQRLRQELLRTQWPAIDLLPAGASLGAVGQVSVDDPWLLRDVLEQAGVSSEYSLVLLDTGGRTGALSTQAMYASDTSYAPIAPTRDAVRKAAEAKVRVDRIQRAHPLRWAGVVLSNFDRRVSMDEAIRSEAHEVFGAEVRAEVPRRSVVHEAFQLGERLGDRRDVASAGLAAIFRGFMYELVNSGQTAAPRETVATS